MSWSVTLCRETFARRGSGTMKERTRFLATETFNVQLKKPVFDRRGSKSGRYPVRKYRAGSNVDTPSRISNGKVVDPRSTYDLSVTSEPTTYQKVRRIIEEHSERQSRSTRRKVGGSFSQSSSKFRESTNYTIVPSSRGENVRNSRNGFSSFSVCETSRAAVRAGKTSGGTAAVTNSRTRRSSNIPNYEGLASSLPARISKLPSVAEASRRPRQVGVKVTLYQAKEPSCCRDLPWGPGSVEDRDGCLAGHQRRLLVKLPSTFLQGNARDSSGRLSSEVKTAQVSRGNGTATGIPESYRTALRRSPSGTLPSSWKKPARVGVKKSVSFSSDTSFQERKSLFSSKTHVHEAKVYHKGVLQDRASPSPSSTTTPTTITSTGTSGGTSALVRAAREGNTATLRQIMARARTPQGGRELDINMVDASGRTAVSYMAGNGTVVLLEAALSFPETDVNLADNEGNTPLHFAAQAGQLECMSIMLQRGAGIEVDARNTLGFTPLMKAALQGRTKCAKILLFAGANPTMRDYGRGLRAEQWARFCGRYVCAEVIERFARHRLLEKTTSCRWGSEPELAAMVLQGKVTPLPTNVPPQSSGLRSKIRRVFRTSSGPDNRSFSLVSQLTSAALCASSPALPRPGDVPPVVKSLIRPLNVPQLRITLVATSDASQPTAYRQGDKCQTNFTEKIASEKIESPVAKPPRSKKKNK